MPIGELPVVWKAATTLRRLSARSFFWPLPLRMVSRRISASASMSKFSHQLLDGLRAHRAGEVLAVTVDQLAVEHLVDDELLELELGEGGPDLVETVQLALGPVTELTHLALAAVLDLAAHVGLGALGLELGDVGLELLGAGLEVGVALIGDGLLLDLHLGLEGGQLVVAELLVDRDDDVGGEVDDLLEILRRQVEQVAEAARHALEVPDVGDRGGQFDVAHALTTHLGAGHLDAAALTDDALEADALVLTAVALPVPGGAEDLLAEEAVLLGLERAVVDGLRLLDLAVGPLTDVLSGGEADAEFIEEVDVEHVTSFPRWVVASATAANSNVGYAPGTVQVTRGPNLVREVVDRRRLVPGQVDAQVRRRPLQVLVVAVAHLDGRAVRGQHLHVEAERLELLEEHLERLGDARLGDVLALDDGLVHLHSTHHVVRLDGEQFLQRVCRAVGLHRPALHLTEALATELGLTAERLLRDHRVRTGRTSVDLVVDQVVQLDDVHVADRDRVRERLAGAAVEQRGLSVRADHLLAVAVRQRRRRADR